MLRASREGMNVEILNVEMIANNMAPSMILDMKNCMLQVKSVFEW